MLTIPRSRLHLSVIALVLAGTVMAAAHAGVPAAGAGHVFEEARVICERDAGVLWGYSLCGPMLLVDPADRTVVANQADSGGVLKASGSLFKGVLPDSQIVANTSIEWSGTRWSEILWPLPDDVEQRHVMIAHELFHRIQPDLKMVRTDGDNSHLDSLDGRYLLQLEWRALAKALQAPTAAARRTAVADALLFRHERYRLFPHAAANEAALEFNEGVAEYTGVMLGLQTPQARVDYAVRDLSAFVSAPTFVRSFAYATGPAYGLLLDQAAPGWRHRLGAGPSMDQLLAVAMKLPPSAFATLKVREAVYDDGSLLAREQKRDQQKQLHLAALKAKLVDGPVLTLPLHHSSYQFNPQTLQPLGELGMVYPTMRLGDDWGVLDVDGDALVNQDKKTATVSAAGIDPSRLKGQGWHLTLNKGWVVVPGARDGDVLVKQVQDISP
jgi:hypothetical protein